MAKSSRRIDSVGNLEGEHKGDGEGGCGKVVKSSRRIGAFGICEGDGIGGGKSNVKR